MSRKERTVLKKANTWKPTLLKNTAPLETDNTDVKNTASHTDSRNRVSIGGFLHSQNLFFTEQSQDIYLKLERALEHVEQAEEARLTAERKALEAHNIANYTEEQIKLAEDNLSFEQRIVLERDQTINLLKETLSTLQLEKTKVEQGFFELEFSRNMAEEKANYAIEYAALLDKNIRQEYSDNLQALEIQNQTLERDRKAHILHLEEKLQLIEAEKLFLEAKENHAFEHQKTTLEKEYETRLTHLQQQIQDLQQQLQAVNAEKCFFESAEIRNHEQLINMQKQLKESLLGKSDLENKTANLEKELLDAKEYTQKMFSIINSEKTYRKTIEKTLVETIQKLEKTNQSQKDYIERNKNLEKKLSELLSCFA